MAVTYAVDRRLWTKSYFTCSLRTSCREFLRQIQSHTIVYRPYRVLLCLFLPNVYDLHAGI